MSSYNGRRGPNVSEYIANLNAIPSAQDLANQEYPNLEDDLAMFTNTQFFDFDLGHDADLSTNFDGHGQGNEGSAENLDMKPLDFVHGEFSFPDFHAFNPPPQTFGLDGLPQIQPADHPPLTASSAGSPTATPSATHSQPNDLKRKAESITSIEDSSRAAAEEDKRRRNTAASARFRVKKKQREQALERSAKEMSDKVAALEGRINLLETENKWLKNLIVEKNENKDDIAALWLKYTQEQAERKGSERKDGVGTKA